MNTSIYDILRQHGKAVLLLLFLLLALPILLFFVRQRQDLRPRALAGKANLLLSSSSTSVANIGDEFTVLVSVQITDPVVKVSGVDFVLLYDKEKLDVVNLVPSLRSESITGYFTDAPIVALGGTFDTAFNFLRVAEVARVADSQLQGGTLSLATVTFRTKAVGDAQIRFPDDNTYLSVVGQ